jgi:hypothetical protein
MKTCSYICFVVKVSPMPSRDVPSSFDKYSPPIIHLAIDRIAINPAPTRHVLVGLGFLTILQFDMMVNVGG